MSYGPADWRLDSRQSVLICHWPSHSSSFSSFSLATAEGDAADGEPAFRHHQRRLRGGRGAPWPDRRKRQGEHNFFSKQSPSNHRDLSFFCLGWQDRKQRSFIHHHCQPSSSLKWKLSLVPVNCSLWLQSFCSDRYSLHRLLYVIFESLFKVIALVFDGQRRVNWDHLRWRVWSAVKV